MATTKFELMQAGAFPNQIDPWIEQGHYFHQLHAQMIGNLLNQIQEPAFDLGYVVGREVSIQIAPSQPDIFVSQVQENPLKTRNYDVLVASLSLEAGIKFQTEREIELDRLFIKSLTTGRLVTVVELISPSNKSEDEKILRYQDRRQNLLNKAVDVVEIDLTRSVKHLINDSIAQTHPYHIAIHLYDTFSRFLGMNLEDNLKSFGLPLEDKAVPVDMNQVYRQSYAELLIANQMYNDKHYTAENLPFPSTLKDAERQNLLEALEAWKLAVKSAD